METRICKKCGKEKEIENFSKYKCKSKERQYKYRRRVCTSCRNNYFKKYSQENKEKKALYARVNCKRINTVRRKYYQQNPEKPIERSKIYSRQNPEKISKAKAIYYYKSGERDRRIEACNNLSNSYICRLLGGGSNFSKELIETKRIQLKIIRYIKQLQI